jgi:hypothetical protein
MYILTIDLMLTMTLTNDRPVLSSERAHHMDRTVTYNQEEISGHESQTGIDTKIGRLTDRQLQCDFDFGFENPVRRKVTLNQVSHSRRKKPGENSRRQTRRVDSRGPVRMERVLGSNSL